MCHDATHPTRCLIPPHPELKKKLQVEIERINQWVDASRASWFLWRQRQYGAAWTFGLKGTF